MVNQQILKNNSIIDSYYNKPDVMHDNLCLLRALIYAVAADLKQVGVIKESLKWGQPSFVPDNKSGTPIRLGIEKKSPGTYGLYVNCSTTLIETVRHIYGDQLKYDGNRGILFSQEDDLQYDIVRHVIEMALTYHVR